MIVFREVMQRDPTFMGGVEAEDFYTRICGWYRRFARRYKWVQLVVCGKGRKLPEGWLDMWKQNVQAIALLRQKVGRHLRIPCLLPPCRLGNMDQCPVWFESVSNTTTAKKGTKDTSCRTGGIMSKIV